MEKQDQRMKRVRVDVPCQKCGQDITAYLAKDFGNEKCTHIYEHEDGRRCTVEVDLFTAHQFETRSLNKFDFGRKW